MTESHVIVEVLEDGARNGVERGVVAVPPAHLLPDPPRPQELTAQELRKAEGDLIDDLFRSDEKSKQLVGVLVLPRLQVRQLDNDGNLKRDAEGNLVYGPVELRLRPLRQSDIDRERRKCGRVWEIGDDGQRTNVFDPTELNARVVVQSLVPEDKAKYLDDKRMWDHFGAGGPVDVLDRWLTAGELSKAGAMVMKLSGIPMDARMERLLVEQLSAEAEDLPGFTSPGSGTA